MANVEPALEQQILDVPQRQRKAHIHHHDQADNLGRRIEIAKLASWFAGARHATITKPPILMRGAFALTETQ